MREKPSYYAIIPASVRYDTSIPPAARLLYGEITCLSNKNGYCFASNGYFAELYGVSKDRVSKWMTLLRRKGYIDIEVITNPDTKQVLERKIRLKEATVVILNDRPVGKKN